MATKTATEKRADHPLDPLSTAEIASAVRLARTELDLTDQHRFVAVYNHEPPKAQVLEHKPGMEFDRQAHCVVLDNGSGRTYEGVLSLSRKLVVEWHHVPGRQPAIMLDEFDEAEQACKADPTFREVLAKRGVTDMDLVCVDPWSAGYYGEDDKGRRLVRALVYTRMAPDDNPYAHPVDNVVALVDLNRMELVRVEDHGVVPVPRPSHNYSAEAVGRMRDDVKPLEIRQPEGPSFTVDGNEVSWQKWRLRVAFTPREGLVLHTVRYLDGERERPILHRASLSEMVVPYGDPTPLQSRKNAFDAGEYNIGALANSLTLGCDCLGEIHYFDAHLCDSRGEPMTIEHAICLHEEDAGMLWKHTDFRTGQVEVRRSRRLVISSISTVANYEYAFYWMLYQDGRIEFEIKLTGIVSTATRPDGADASYGQRLNGDGLYAPIHEHLFNVRLDLDVDGEDNAIYEIDTEATPPGSENPFGNAFRAVPRLLESEIGARRDVDPSRSRHWLVVNRERRNRVGEPVGYRLIPSGSVPRYSQDDAFVSQRAGFTAHHLWVTPYDPQQLHAAGDYPNQSRGGDGLPAWTREDRPLVDRDVVLWYTLGSNHIVRLEDWPLTPAKAIGFMLEPCGFFDETPALDVPPEPAAHCSRSNGDA